MMPWFKFYGPEYLSDPKMLELRPVEKALWVTILCLASQNDGIIKYISEHKIMILTGIDPIDDEWSECEGFLKKFVKLSMITMHTLSSTLSSSLSDNKMITLTNYHKRQDQNLTPYERVKKCREKHKNEAKKDNKPHVINDNGRIDKKRIDKNKKKENYAKERVSTEDGGVGKSLLKETIKVLGLKSYDQRGDTKAP